MGKCLFMRKGETHTAPVSYNANFSDNTWEQIIDACQKNAVPDAWLVGDQKAMTINGTVYAIDIIGKNHDDYADGSGKAPLTFQLHDCYEKTYMDNSSTSINGWTGSVMRTAYLPSVLLLMPSEVQTSIKEVNKLTSTGNLISTLKSSSDKLFLLSEVEIFGTTPNSYSGEGIQYDYYAAGNSKIKNLSESAVDWWERSPFSVNENSFCRIWRTGIADYTSPTDNNGVSFAFCF